VHRRCDGCQLVALDEDEDLTDGRPYPQPHDRGAAGLRLTACG
jgi:hypothetical protein